MKKYLALIILVWGLSCSFVVFAQDVTPSGAFTYTYPIDIPDGINGMQPNISLVYNSQAGNGIAGLGWTLTGFPVITRDTTYPINWTDEDHFMYNGQRLIPDSDPYKEGIYHTEMESFEVIEFIPGSDSYWVVTQQNGTKLYFGSTDNSCIEGVGKNAPLHWSLSKVQDINDNFYEIEYAEDIDNGDYYPIRITFTKSNNITVNNEILFSYESRLDHYPIYQPSKQDIDHRLKWITVKSNDKAFLKYELEYLEQNTAIDYSRLLAIRIYGDDGSDPTDHGFPFLNYSYNPNTSFQIETKFDWNIIPEDNITVKDWGNPEVRNWDLTDIAENDQVVGLFDVDGDGLLDRIWSDYFFDKDYFIKLEQYKTKTIGLSYNNGQSFETPFDWEEKIISSERLINRNGDSSDVAHSLIDIDGNGTLDRVWRGGSGITFSINQGSYFIENNETYDVSNDWYLTEVNNDSGNDVIATFIDVNGDGMIDRIWKDGSSYPDLPENYSSLWYAINKHLYRENDGCFHLFLNSRNGFLEDELNWGDPEDTLWDLTEYRENSGGDVVADLIDITGDGLPDRVWKDDNAAGDYIYVSRNNGNGFSEKENWGNPEGYSWDLIEIRSKDDTDTIAGLFDMNGDGLVDRVWKDNDDIYVAFNNGNGFISSDNWGNPENESWDLIEKRSGAKADTIASLLDVNGDSLPDRTWKNGENLYVSLNYGSGFEEFIDLGNLESSSWDLIEVRENTAGESIADFYDIDGDGLLERVWKNGGNLQSKGIALKGLGEICRIYETSGLVVDIEYVPAPRFDYAVYPEDSIYPYVSNSSTRKLVRDLSISDDLDLEISTTYDYFNGKIQKGKMEDQKDLGFEWIQKRNPDGTSVKTHYYQEENDALFARLVKRQEIFGSDGNIYSADEYTYAAHEVAPKSDDYHSVNFIKLTDQYGYSFDGEDYSQVDWDTLKTVDDKIVTHVEYKYDDSLGTVVLVTDEGDLSLRQDDTITVSIYGHDDATNITVPNSVLTFAYPLDSEDSILVSEENIVTRKEFFYDGNHEEPGVIGTKGQLTQKIEYSGETNQSAFPNVVHQISYDEYGNILSVTDGLENTSTLEYDQNFPSAISKRIKRITGINDYDLIIEENGYDDYGRLGWSKDINGNYTWYGYDSFHRIVSVSNGSSSGPDRELSRTAYSDIEDPDASPQWIRTETYSPTENNSENYITNYTYFDGLGNTLQTKTECINESGTPGWSGVSYYVNYETGETRVSEPVFFSSYESDYSTPDWGSTRHTATYADALGRVYKTVYPDGTSEYVKYGLYDQYNLTETPSDGTVMLYSNVENGILKNYSYEKGYLSYEDLGPSATSSWKYMTQSRSGSDGSEILELSIDDQYSTDSGNKLSTLVDNLGRKISYTDPDLGEWTYTYDANGNLASQTDAKNNTISFEYDELNRVTRKIGAQTIIYCYDGMNADGTEDTEDHGPDPLGRLTKLYKTSGSYSESYYYDDVNREYRVTKTIFGKSRTVTTTLDEIGRVIEEIYPDGENVTYSYKEDGSLVSMQQEGATFQYISDLKYNLFSQIEDYDLGNGATVDYTYNDNHYLTGLDIQGISVQIADMDFEYDEWGNIKYKSFIDGYNNGYNETLGYDGFNRLESATSNGLYDSRNYSYDNYNNMTRKGNLEYFYEDTAGPHAVTTIRDYDSGDETKTYEYDANGNVTKITGRSHMVIRAKGTGIISSPPRMELWLGGEKADATWIVNTPDYQNYYWDGVIPDGATVDIVFPNNNWDGGVDTNLMVDWIEVNGTKIETESDYAIFDRGNYPTGCFDSVDTLTGLDGLYETGAMRYFVSPDASATVRRLYYDSENRMTSIKDNGVTVASYVYDPAGRRIRQDEGGKVTYNFFDNYEEVYSSISGSPGLEYKSNVYFANGQRIGYRKTLNDGSSEVYYYHQDHLGSAVRVTDSECNPIQSIAYSPYGEVVWFAGEEGNNITFTGQELDASGFMYFNARYYDPELGRFLQADTLLDGLNRYTYCGNNPVRYVDPTGHRLSDPREPLDEHDEDVDTNPVSSAPITSNHGSDNDDDDNSNKFDDIEETVNEIKQLNLLDDTAQNRRRIRRLKRKLWRQLNSLAKSGSDVALEWIQDNTHLDIIAHYHETPKGNSLDGVVILSFMGVEMRRWDAQTFCDEENINLHDDDFTLGNGSGSAIVRMGSKLNVRYKDAIILSNRGHFIHKGKINYIGGGSEGCIIMDQASMASMMNSLKYIGFRDNHRINYTISGSKGIHKSVYNRLQSFSGQKGEIF